MRRFTISGASTIVDCRYPYRADVVMPPEVRTEEAEAGSSVHDCSAKFINTAEATELLDPATHPVWASARAWIVANWRQTWVAEPAYAWSPALDYAKQLGVDIGREYEKHGAHDGNVCGTLDIRSIEGDCVYVYELGTGHDVGHKYHQMRLQCAVAALAHGCSRAVGQVVRFDEDGAYPSPPVEFDEFALAAIRGEFAEYLSEVEGSEPKPGDHCSRCNLAPVCPAAASIVAELVPVEALVPHRWGLTIASPDHAAWLLAHARLVAAAAEAVKEQVKAYVPKEGLCLEDGSLLVEGTRQMPRTDHKKVAALAVALGATPEQIESCSYIATESAGLKVKKPAKARLRKAS